MNLYFARCIGVMIQWLDISQFYLTFIKQIICKCVTKIIFLWSAFICLNLHRSWPCKLLLKSAVIMHLLITVSMGSGMLLVCEEISCNTLPTAECPVKMSQSKTQKSSIFIHLETVWISVSAECLKCKDVKCRLRNCPIN